MSAKAVPEVADGLAPEANPELLGHAEAQATLLAAVDGGRLPHAWLISGPRGVGKATLAYRFARYLLAGGRPPSVAGLFGELPDEGGREGLAVDAASPTFRQVAAGGHPDMVTLRRGIDSKSKRPRRDIAVDDVRAAIGFLRMTSAGGGWRVVVVDSADDLNVSSANALLKVLEEPPPRALLLLVSHRPGRLLATIRSRCRQLALSPLDEALVVELLGRHAPGLEAADAAALARLSEGSIGRALELERGGGLALYRELIEMLDELPRLNVARLHDFGERLARDGSGEAFRTGTELLSWWLARMLRARAAGTPAGEVVAGEEALMQRLLARRGLAPWLALWEKLALLFARAESASLDRKQVVITAFLEIEALAA